ncbi:MAG TPA: thioredoxin domain-containing protein [Streptosporangiaceae bacterium]|nr:thioredoxin domain-containing protein [Streptosporangiaceae bacterium]
MAERLLDATSPYLLQHADNPVDWWQWSDEAFAAAAERDVPVLLSVGYSACHWCHVMAHESFEDEQTARLMNDNLVSIKVDREERPDVDSVYMAATQAMTGQGGWPMTVFLTPDREPFLCFTYVPRAQFQRLVLGVARAWREDRTRVAAQASQIAAALADQARPLAGADLLTAAAADESGAAAAGGPAAPVGGLTDGAPLADLADATIPPAERGLAGACEVAVTSLARDFDARRGGFGGAPKFPPSMVLEFLLRHAERVTGDGADQALAMARLTADAMARGGMYDQLAGGFARYSVDADWVVPHFEKMLYDNALLARGYAHLWRRTGSPLARRVAIETCEWLLAGMQTAAGGFAAALDADSEGGEGAFYVWTPAQLAAALGPDDGGYAAAVFGVTEDGTFEHGASVLQLRADPPDPDRFGRVRAGLLAARSSRPRPGRDDKVVAAWNGLAIAALAEAGLLFARPDFVAAATAAAELLVAVHLDAGRLTRTSRDGVASATPGVLDDYGCVAAGLIALASVTTATDAAARWLAVAGELLATVLARFGTGTGGFYDTADDAERLIYRPADVADGPSPSGTFAAADALLSYAALTGSDAHRAAAVAALAPVPALVGRYPRAAGAGLAVAEAVLSGPVEIAVVGPATAQRDELHRTALAAAPPGAVIACGDVSRPDGARPRTAGDAPADDLGGGPGGTADTSHGDGAVGSLIPLLAGRGPVDGKPAAYVCRNFTCQVPVTEVTELRTALR